MDNTTTRYVETSDVTNRIGSLGEQSLTDEFDAMEFLVDIICESDKTRKLGEARRARLATHDIFRKNSMAAKIFSERELNLAAGIKKLVAEFQWRQISSKKIVNPEDAVEYLKTELNRNDTTYVALYLTKNKRIISCDDKIGSAYTPENAYIYPRNIIHHALEHNAECIILAHSNPHGTLDSPTPDEIEMTSRVGLAAKKMSLTFLDHLVIGSKDHYSYRSAGGEPAMALEGTSRYSPKFDQVNEQTANYGKKEHQQNPLVKELNDHLDKLAAKIDSKETQDTIKSLFAFSGAFHKYSANNNLLLMMQAARRKTNVERFASFKTWTSLSNSKGRVRINAGEKGYDILVPVVVKSYLRDDKGTFVKDEKGNKIPELDGNGKQIERCVGFNTGKVFDIGQTNAKQLGLGEIPSISIDGQIDKAIVDKIIGMVSNTFGVKVATVPESMLPQDAKGYYNASEHMIKLNENLSSNEEKLCVFLHECGHMALHRDQILSGKMAKGDMNRRSAAEGEAEAFSYALSNTLGIKPRSEIYIAEWGNTGKQLKERIDKITTTIHMFISLTDIDRVISEKKTTDIKKTKVIEKTIKAEEEDFSIKNTICESTF